MHEISSCGFVLNDQLNFKCNPLYNTILNLLSSDRDEQLLSSRPNVNRCSSADMYSANVTGILTDDDILQGIFLRSDDEALTALKNVSLSISLSLIHI